MTPQLLPGDLVQLLLALRQVCVRPRTQCLLLQVAHVVGGGGREAPTQVPVCLHPLLFHTQVLHPDYVAYQPAVTSGPPPDLCGIP